MLLGNKIEAKNKCTWKKSNDKHHAVTWRPKTGDIESFIGMPLVFMTACNQFFTEETKILALSQDIFCHSWRDRCLKTIFKQNFVFLDN